MTVSSILIRGGLIAAIFGALPALADNAGIMVAECHKQLKLGDSGCACIGERAEDTLNEKQQKLVVAMVQRDSAATASMRANMSAEEVTGATNFMSSAPQACAD